MSEAPGFLNTMGQIGESLGQAKDKLIDWGKSLWDQRDKVLDVAKQIADYLVPKFEALWHTIRDDVLPVVNDLWHNFLEPLIPVFGATLVVAIGLAIDALNWVLSGLSGLVKGIQDGNPIIWGLVGLFGTLAAAMAFNAVFDALTIGFATLRLITIPSVMASIGAMQAAILAPLVMPAIAVGAALAALALVFKAAKDAHEAVNNAKAAAEAADRSFDASHGRLLELQKNGTAEQKARANAAIRAGFAGGGFTGRGGVNEVAGIVHKGEYVLPQSAVDQSSGLPKSAVGGNTTNNIYVTLASGAAVDRFAQKFGLNQELRGMGMAV